MKKIRTILIKEWQEVFKNRMVVFTILFMPLMFTALPLIILGLTSGSASADMSSEIPPQMAALCGEDLTGGQCFQVMMVSQFMVLYMMMPLIIPTNIAAYSVVGEKTTRSLEPLLATPITTIELLAGKNLASVIPAVAATWLGFGIYIIGAIILAGTGDMIGVLLDPLWFVAIFVVGPLLAILSVNFALIVSSRVNDPRVAEQISAVVILPVLLLFFGQLSGVLVLSRTLILWMALFMVLIDAVILYFAVQLFQRETILTRWK